jgi:hypothetical protein
LNSFEESPPDEVGFRSEGSGVGASPPLQSSEAQGPQEEIDVRLPLVQTYVGVLGALMGLESCQFFLKQLDLGERYAFTRAYGHSKTFDLHIDKDFFKLSAVFQREILVHELMHWHFDAMDTFVKSTFSNVLGNGVLYDQFKFSLDQFQEYAVDAVACAWAKQMPPISWLPG